jgi:hypothetical protein
MKIFKSRTKQQREEHYNYLNRTLKYIQGTDLTLDSVVKHQKKDASSEAKVCVALSGVYSMVSAIGLTVGYNSLSDDIVGGMGIIGFSLLPLVIAGMVLKSNIPIILNGRYTIQPKPTQKPIVTPQTNYK